MAESWESGISEKTGTELETDADPGGAALPVAGKEMNPEMLAAAWKGLMRKSGISAADEKAEELGREAAPRGRFCGRSLRLERADRRSGRWRLERLVDCSGGVVAGGTSGMKTMPQLDAEDARLISLLGLARG